MGHLARVCRSKQNKNDQRRINYLEETSSEEEEESEPEEIRQITQINKNLSYTPDPRSPSCHTTRKYTKQKKSNQ